MRILRIIYQGYNNTEGQFAHCFILLNETLFSTQRIYEISVKHKYPVCSEIKVDVLIKTRCAEAGGEFWDAYLQAEKNGHSFTQIAHSSNSTKNLHKVPRFSETDFENIVINLGGIKVKESTIQTPDFYLNKIVLELKDLQTDSLNNVERQKSIGTIFKDQKGFCFDVDPSIDYGPPTKDYHRLISNTIQNHFKKASQQIKSFKEVNNVECSGIILLNTGMFSLPHDLFKSMVQDILTRLTITIEFAFIFSQIMQKNAFEVYAVFKSEFLGTVPDKIKILKEKTDLLVEEKMTAMILKNEAILEIDSIHPISFFSNGKIYYWNPGAINDSRYA